NDEPDWLEIFNNSNFVINLNVWEVGDVLTNPVFTKITNEDIFIEPNSYLVIAKDETIFNYHKMILSQTIFTKFANLNNDSDGIVIKDNREITIDSVLYESNWGTRGNSIERKNKSFSSTNKNNWGTSIDIESSTPGRVNSISPKNIDIAAIAINTIPKNPVKNDFVTIQLKLKNYGEQNSESVNVKFYYGNKVPDNLLEEIDINSINKGDTLNIITTKKIKIEDTLIIAAQIQTQNDEDIINNYIEKSIIAGFNLHTLLINEIMFKTENDAPEWIELYNNADSTINLKGWQISNGNLTSIITEENIFVEPNYFIVLSDLTNKNYFEKEEVKVIYTELPELNDRKDDVIIYDYRNAVIDSINYEVSNNMIPNISLERISLSSESSDQLNWTFSLSSFGSTPGNENSVKTLPSNNFGDLIFTEIMFNPNENNSEYLEIYNTGENPIEIGGWKVMVGEVIFTLSDFSYMLNSQSYFTLSADSSIYSNYEWLKDSDEIKIVNASSLGLTNTGKTIYLIDYKNEIIDSLNYSDAWHNSAFEETKNISLELINVNLDRTRSSNWSSSVSSFGGSPGKQNSIYIDKNISQTKLSISPNPFSPDNDGFEDFTIISYNLKEAISQIRIRIFDSKGRMVRTLANNIPSGSQGEIIFDGLDTLGNPLRIGIYIILFEAINPNNAVVEVLKEVVVVARKL
ncbi:MAG: lamin tail domain-containing protein, partial [Ignavibacteriae bacterium]|nr:lamin tail domain-containing protein [Ignavibacteriota bacterium]